MSLSRNNKLWGVAGSLLGRLSKKRANAREQKPTKLLIDQLEERQLLSLTVATTENLLVNTSWQDIRGEVSVDSNESGDVVVAWTAADRLLDPDSIDGAQGATKYLTDKNGNYVEDLNIYARYLTDEVQIIEIPDECVPGTDLGGQSSVSGSFSLLYNAYETQRFSIYSSDSMGTAQDVYKTENSLSCFYLGFYAEGELTWILYKYDANLLPGDNATNLQNAIRNIKGGEYANVEVNAYSETDFDITFYDSDKATWAGYDLADIRVSNNYTEDVNALVDKVSSVSFEVEDLKKCSDFQKLILKDTFGDNYTTTISKMIKTEGRSAVIKKLKIARDSVSDALSSGVVTTVKEVQKITAYNSKGNEVGIAVSDDPYVTAQNIQNAFNNAGANNDKLYAPITRGYEYNVKTHRFEYTNVPTSAYSADESYGSMQSQIKSVEVVVEPALDPNGVAIRNQFKVTFTGASGLQNQDPLMVSSATYVTKSGKSYLYTDVVAQNGKTQKYEYIGSNPTGQDYSVDTATVTVKESSAVFRVNAVETVEYQLDEDGDVITDRWGDPVILGTGRSDQSKPDVAMSGDGSFVIVWENENANDVYSKNATDIAARRFVAQGYIAEEGEGGYDENYKVTFYSNGSVDGSYDVYDTDVSPIKVQCVAPVADQFVVNAELNGKQTDPTVAGDQNGNFIVAWTYLAQDNSYFGGIYGRQYNNEAQPTTGDIAFASGQVGTNYYGPASASMSDDGFAVVLWNYTEDLYQAALEPKSAVFIVDNQLVAANSYGSNVSFDFNGRYTLSYTQEETGGVAGTDWLPTTDCYVSIYQIVKTGKEQKDTAFARTTTVTTNSSNAEDDEEESDVPGTTHVGRRERSEIYTSEVVVDAMLVNTITVGDQGKPSSGMDADGDVFVAYQGYGMDIHSVSAVSQKLMYSSNYDDLYIQLSWSDFEDNNLIYENKCFDRGGKLSYESKNEDLIDYVKKALGWGYETTEDGDVLVEDGATPIYVLHNYDCIDADCYIRYFLSVAQKEKATDEQVSRLAAVLETLLSPLRNNGNDINYIAYGQTIYGGSVAQTDSSNAEDDAQTNVAAKFVVDPSAISGVVSGYRNGANACFYLTFPAEYVASANISLVIGRKTDNDRYETNEDTAETVNLDLSGYYDAETGLLKDYKGLIESVSTALNSMAICDGDAESFVVRYVSLEEMEFYKGTVGEIGCDVEGFEYPYMYEIEGVGYTGTRKVKYFSGLQIVAQNSLHDTPLYIRYDVDASSVKLMNQLSDTADYALMATDLYVEREGETGNSQTNADVAMSPSGDVVVAWAMGAQKNATTRSDLYPNVGNSLDDQYSHIYLRSFVESTDTAGPIVVNATLPNGEKINEGQTVPSAVKDIVVAFNENMMTVGDGTSSYATRHAVDNASNWTLLRDGVAVDGAIESVTFGMNASRDLARVTVDENGDEVDEINDGDLAYGTNRWEAVVHFADGYELKDGNYTLVCSAMVQDSARNALYSQGYADDGSSAGFDGKDWELGFSVIRLNEALAFEYSAAFPRNSYISVDPVHGDEVVGDPSTDPIEQAKASGDYLSQVTRSTIEEETSDYGPNTAQAVASNTNGDYVVVWTETTYAYDEDAEIFFITDANGNYLDGNGARVSKTKKDAQAIERVLKNVTETVYARTYRSLYVLDAEGNRTQVIQEDRTSEPIVIYQSECSYYVYNDVTGTVKPQTGAATMTEAAYDKAKKETFISGSDTMGQTLTEGPTNPRQASVSMDDKGDFVVAWDMMTYGEYEDGSRDVYLAKYAFNGGQMSINGNASTPIRANIETTEDQQYASVAMDADGDIVVVWESYDQDGSGWGIYGRRFATSGLSYGYANTIQVIQLDGSINIQGDKLAISVYNEDTGKYDAPVYANLVVEMKANAESVKQALIDSGHFTEDDLTVEVTANNSIAIEFKGAYTGAYIDQLSVKTNNTNLKAYVSTRQRGVEGSEFLVNQTTENNQRFASIGMSRDGSFVVSWTSWGQDEDAATESNVYARQFASNHIISTSVATIEELVISNDPVKVITTENIELHEVTAGQGYDSVCKITIGASNPTEDEDNAVKADDDTGTDDDADTEGLGTGSLLTTRQHILTAAHVVCDENGVPVDPAETPIWCTFETPNGKIRIRVEDVYVHETYAGNPAADQVDLAVLKLAQPAPSYLTGYELYTGSSELGQTITFVGYGTYGDVKDGRAENTRVGVKHEGKNVYELTGADFDNAGNPNTLIYDFDDGTYANDYLGNYCGVRNLGLGREEAITAPGDSGSPSFIGNQIAGICSYGSDINSQKAFGPGNYQVDVRVSSYADWINSVILSSSGDEFLVNTDVNSYIVNTGDDDDEDDGDDQDVTTTDYWQVGNQYWSNVAMDNDGNFVITWTGYNQDGNGDALTGASNNGLGGIFMRAFVVSDVVLSTGDSDDSDSSSSATSNSVYTSITGSLVQTVNQYTAYDQVHSQVAMTGKGDFVVVYESYQDPSNDVNSDVVDNFGIYARRYSLTSKTLNVDSGDDSSDSDSKRTTTTVKVHDLVEVGAEFKVSRTDPFDLGADGDQLGGSVAVDANGDMVFVWSDLSYEADPQDRYDNIHSVVMMRSIALPYDTTPPYVTRANAAYRNGEGGSSQVSLYANNVAFASGNGPTAMVYSFSEYMYSAQMFADIKDGDFEKGGTEGGRGGYNGMYVYSDATVAENKNIKSVLNYGNWTLTCRGKDVTSTYIEDIYYGYNASNYAIDILRSQGRDPSEYVVVADPKYKTDTYELVIVYKQELADGAYVLTLDGSVTDSTGKSKTNSLDGNYDGVGAGRDSFSVRWTVGSVAAEDDDVVPSHDQEAFVGELAGNANPVVVSNSDGFIIVTEEQKLVEFGGSNTDNTNNNSRTNTQNAADDNEDDPKYSNYGYYKKVVVDGVTYRVESDVVMRTFNADGSPSGVETRVNAYATGNQMDPDIALTEGGSYVVVWNGASDLALNGVCARFYPGGKSQAQQVQVAGTRGTRCWDAHVSINDATGLVLITWLQGSADSGNTVNDVYGRFYDLNGNAKSAAFKLISAEEAGNTNTSVSSFDDPYYSYSNYSVASYYDPTTGEIQFRLAWFTKETIRENNQVNTSEEIYQKCVTAVRTESGMYRMVDGTPSKVNQTTTYNQTLPQIAIDESTGDYYITWTSNQIIGNGNDIYARKFDKYGNSLSFMGTTQETIVNSYVKDVQSTPSVAANADGVVFAWKSYGEEEFNYNSQLQVEQRDYGVAVRVFNSQGLPVYVTGDTYDEDGLLIKREVGQVLEMDQGEFIINSTVENDQFDPDVAVFDWTHSSESGYAAPKFVVVWAGPNPRAGEETEESVNSTSSSSSTNDDDDDDQDSTEGGNKFIGPFMTFYKLVAAGSVVSNDAGPTISSKAFRFDINEASSTSKGFYRPVDVLVEQATAASATYTASSDDSLYAIYGTDGDDKIVVTASKDGVVASITLNGKKVSVPASASTIYFLGGKGNDQVVYNAAGSETAAYDANAAKVAFVGTKAFIASEIENVETTGELAEFAVEVANSGDLVELAPGAVSVSTSTGAKFTANGVKNVVALGGGKASVVMNGSAGDDALYANGSYAILVGADYSLSAASFASIRVNAGAGDDVAQVVELKDAVATDTGFMGSNGSAMMTAFGFENVSLQGYGSASVYGTRGSDSVYSTGDGSKVVFSTGSSVELAGFASETFDGMGGKDSAVLVASVGANEFDGWENKATLTNSRTTKKLNNFSNVRVYGSDDEDGRSSLAATLHDTARDDAFAAFGDTATLDVDGVNLFEVVGADSVKVKGSYGKGADTLTVDEAIDFVFSTEDWDF